MEDGGFKLHLRRPVRVFWWERETGSEETTYASKLVSILQHTFGQDNVYPQAALYLPQHQPRNLTLDPDIAQSSHTSIQLHII